VIREKKNLHEVEISGYAHDGAGVGRIEGQVVFVPGALRGEKVLVEIDERRKGVLRGKVREILLAGGERLLPTCSVYARCGGCQLQHVTYAAQLKIKEEIVRETLQRLGRIKDVTVHPVLGMATPWGYRNKGYFQVGHWKEKVSLGFFEEGSHCLVAEPCRHLFSPKVTSLLEFLEEILTTFQVKVAEKGLPGLQQILIRESRAKGEILVAFIYSGEYSNKKEAIAREVSRKYPEVVGICQSENTRAVGAVPENERKRNKGNKANKANKANTVEIIRGRDWLEDKIGPFSFRISPASFFQVNSVQTKVLYEKVLEYAALSGEEEVVDAYCGIGTISLFLAQRARKVTGIEIIPEAVADARKNAERNRINNVEFVQGKAEKLLPEMIARGKQPEVVVVDPPRKGCDRELLDSIITVRAQRVVYVSCNPATLARDLRYLTDGGYTVEEVQPIDMFPQTSHVETVVLMSRAK
jgi:23S rRNA (uracil1939-C5)-methyltransferase